MWALRTSTHRARSQWKLLLVITAVAVIACSLITSLAVLVSATEQGGLRAELGTAKNTDLQVSMFSLTAPLSEATEATTNSIATLLGPSVDAPLANSIADSAMFEVPALATDKVAQAFVAEYSAVRDHATLDAGEWPTGAGQVALPSTAAAFFGLAIGDSIALDVYDEPKTVEVSGLYTADDIDGEYWSRQTLGGKGFDPTYPLPDILQYIPTNAFGPLLLAPGGFDTVGIPVDRADLTYIPDFSHVDVADLPAVADRLVTAYQDIPSDVGDVASYIAYFSTLDETTDAAASGLIVTRSTVVVTTLLLLVLAVAALAQTARLLVDARAAERQLMVSRGANRRQVLLLALIEALAIGIITALLSPVLASLAYALLAAQPAMMKAGMPATAPPTQFALAAVVALVFVVILIAPLFRRQRRAGRQRRLTGIMTSGLDIGVVALAAVAYWQLSTYRSPVEQSIRLSVDPILVAGPALVLLAGALVSVRLIPLVARVFESLAARSSGALIPLAAWEVGRRAQRAIAAVLLLTLALAVATFSLSFLATWKQSQVDQADLTIGASVRVPAVESATGSQGTLLGDGQPTTRREATVAGPSADIIGPEPPSGTQAIVMGLTAGSRSMLGEGRIGREGGSALEPALDTDLGASEGITIDGDARAISATVSAGDAAAPFGGAALTVHLVLEDQAGLLSTVDLGEVALDGQPVALSGELQAGLTMPQRIVGLQYDAFVADSDAFAANGPELFSKDYAATILVSDLSIQVTDDLVTQPLSVDPGIAWSAVSSGTFAAPPEVVQPPDGAQLRLDIAVPSSIDVMRLSYTMIGWQPVSQLSGVMSADLAHTMNVGTYSTVYLVMDGSPIAVTVKAITPVIPGSGIGTALTSSRPTAFGTIAVDQAALFRVLVEHGSTFLPLDEWWVDVPAGQAQQYLDAHADVPGIADAASRELLAIELQEGPLRVATQAALWLAIAAAALLAAIGFAVHTAATLSSRSAELAQLRAIGFSRRSIVGLVGAESALLAALGALFGITIGVLLAYLAGPLIAVSPTGEPTVPSVIVDVPWLTILALLVELLAVLAIVVAGVARGQKSSDPATILRAGG
jgi:ABC-type antimicrobial peptide transport system permease subunit